MDHRAVAHTAINQYHAAQDQDELSTFLSLVDDPGIRRVIEIGTFAGGLTWALEQIPSVEQVITMDIAERPRYIGPKTKFILGRSSNNATVVAVDEGLGFNQADLLIIDGGHLESEVNEDWEMYRSLVRQGGMVMFHDINEWNHHPDIQVRKAWLEVSSHYPHVEICANRWTSPGTGLLWLIGE
jgi:predicted O-methyltransferase YrrM